MNDQLSTDGSGKEGGLLDDLNKIWIYISAAAVALVIIFVIVAIVFKLRKRKKNWGKFDPFF